MSPSLMPVACTLRERTGTAALQRRCETVEHQAHDGWDTGHDMNIADRIAGRDMPVVDDDRAARHGRHALSCRVEPTFRIVRLHARPYGRLGLPRHAKSRGDAFAGDVVVSRTDAAGGKNMVEAGAHFIDGGDDGVRHVRDNANFPHWNTEFAQTFRKEIDVNVLGAAGQDLIADDDDA